MAGIISSLVNNPLRHEIENTGGVKLIYIDPPFDVGSDFKTNVEIGEEDFEKEPRYASHSSGGVIELMPISDGHQFSFKYVNGHPKNFEKCNWR